RALREMAVEVLFLHPDSQTPGKAGKRTLPSLRLLPPAQDQDQGQLRKGHAALAHPLLPSQHHRILFKQGSQHLAHSCYTRHKVTPVRRKRGPVVSFIFSQKRLGVTLVSNS